MTTIQKILAMSTVLGPLAGNPFSDSLFRYHGPESDQQKILTQHDLDRIEKAKQKRLRKINNKKN